MSKRTIEPGTYSARATAWAWDTTQNGKPFLTINFDVEGATVRGRLYFDTDRTDTNGRTGADRSMEALRAMGLRTNLRALVTGAERIDVGRVQVKTENNAAGYPVVKYIDPLQPPKLFTPATREQMLELIASVDGAAQRRSRGSDQILRYARIGAPRGAAARQRLDAPATDPGACLARRITRHGRATVDVAPRHYSPAPANSGSVTAGLTQPAGGSIAARRRATRAATRAPSDRARRAAAIRWLASSSERPSSLNRGALPVRVKGVASMVALRCVRLPSPAARERER